MTDFIITDDEGYTYSWDREDGRITVTTSDGEVYSDIIHHSAQAMISMLVKMLVSRDPFPEVNDDID